MATRTTRLSVEFRCDSRMWRCAARAFVLTAVPHAVLLLRLGSGGLEALFGGAREKALQVEHDEGELTRACLRGSALRLQPRARSAAHPVRAVAGTERRVQAGGRGLLRRRRLIVLRSGGLACQEARGAGAGERVRLGAPGQAGQVRRPPSVAARGASARARLKTTEAAAAAGHPARRLGPRRRGRHLPTQATRRATRRAAGGAAAAVPCTSRAAWGAAPENRDALGPRAWPWRSARPAGCSSLEYLS
eukprot:scaffold1333_cov274-Prasinococcus_capsulatus_cf.AAC.7